MKRRPTLGAIFLTIMLDLLGFGLVLPFLAEEARDGFHTTSFVAALIGAVYSLMQFLFVPVWGRLSDRVGRRPVLVWSVLASGLSMLGLGLGLSFGGSVLWLFAARFFGGVATANLGTASAYIADVTTKEDRARGMGMIGMAFGIGFILGPALGGILGKITINGRAGAVACFVAAGLSLVNFIWVVLGLPESLPPENRAALPPERRRSLSPIDFAATARVFRDQGILRAVLVNFIMITAFTILDQTFRLMNKDAFQMDALATGLVLAMVGLVAAGVQGGLIRPLTRRYADSRLVRAGAAIQALAFLGLALSPDLGLGLLYFASALLAVGNGITQPTIASFVSKRASVSEQGATLGTNQSFAALARTVGPALGGYVYEVLGVRSPYFVAAGGMALATVVALSLHEEVTSR